MSTASGQRFRVDHVVIHAADRDAIAAKIAALSGREVLEGHRTGGALRSVGVRFANGVFLDIFQDAPASPALILQGPLHDLEALAGARSWALEDRGREAMARSVQVPPWSILGFGPCQGLLSHILGIEYATDPAAWRLADYSGPLYPPGGPPDAGTRLRRVWVGARDLARAAGDLGALGFVAAGPVGSEFPPHEGTLYRGSRADLVLFSGPDGVARLDIDGRELQRVALTPDLALVAGES